MSNTSTVKKRSRVSVLFLTLISIFSLPAFGSDVIFFDSNFMYFSEAGTQSSSQTLNRTFYDICLGFSVTKGSKLMAGWNYANYSSTDSSTVSTTYQSTQMGPKFIYFFNKNRNWRLGVAYNLSTVATYSADGTTSDKWKGTGYSADFGYQFELSETFRFGVRLNYSSSAFKESLVGGSVYTEASYTKTFIYPSLSLGVEF